MFRTSSFSLHVFCIALQTLSVLSSSSFLNIDNHLMIISGAGPTKDIQKRDTNFDIFFAADDREISGEVSAGADVPNSWLYKFPPWFLPHNPPPDGFYANRHNDINSHLGSSEENPQYPADGDIVILSDITKSDRSGRLQNIKVPGNSRFRDEIVKTLVDITVRKSGTTHPVSNSQVISSGISIKDVTPDVLKDVPPTPSVPVRKHTGSIRIQQAQRSTLNLLGNAITVNPPSDTHNIIIHSQPVGNKDFNFQQISEPHINSKNGNQHLVIPSQSLGNKDFNFNFQRAPEQDTNSKNRNPFVHVPSLSVENQDLHFRRDPKIIATSPTHNLGGFRPSPRDLSQTAGSTRFSQNPLHLSTFNSFRPSSLTSSSGDQIRKPIFQSPFESFGKQLPTQDHQTNLKFRQSSISFEDNIQTLGNNAGSLFNSQEHQQLTFQKTGPLLQHNTIENAIVKNSANVGGQLNEFSSYSTLNRQQDTFENKPSSLWVPSIPNILPPPFQQRGLQSVTSNQQSQFGKQITQPINHENNQRFRSPKSLDVKSQIQNNRQNANRPSGLPTSIQDIINSDIDNSQFLSQRARERQAILSPFSSEDEDEWLWTRLS